MISGFWYQKVTNSDREAKYYMFGVLKRIIERMLDFYRRVWQAFFIGSPALAGIAWLFKETQMVFIILLILASICFVVALIGLYLDYRGSRLKDKMAFMTQMRDKLDKRSK